jgi:hypothetical protein
MNYEEFKSIPVPVFHTLHAMLSVKVAYGMELTNYDRILLGHFNTLSEEIQVSRQKAFLEHCLTR